MSRPRRRPREPIGAPAVQPADKPQPLLFLQWFADQYDACVPNADSVRITIGYLQGMLDAIEPGAQRFVHLRAAIAQLQSLEVMVRTLHQYEVRMPHG